MIKIGNWQSASNMLLSSFPLYQNSWNTLIAQRLPKARKQKIHPQKNDTKRHPLNTNKYTTRQHWTKTPSKKKKKTIEQKQKTLIINHLIPHPPHFPTYPTCSSPCHFRQIPNLPHFPTYHTYPLLTKKKPTPFVSLLFLFLFFFVSLLVIFARDISVIPTSFIKVYFSLLSQLRSASSLFF